MNFSEPLAHLALPAAPQAPAAPAAGGASPPNRRVGMPSLSCVVPCFNEAHNIELLFPVLQELLSGLVDHWEIVFVDDGSTDGTARVIEALMPSAPVRLVVLSRNFGKEAALSAGMQAARGEVVVLMDADLQHPPRLIEAMVERWREGADVVYAMRTMRGDESLWKRIGARWTYGVLNVASRVKVPAGAGDFRLLDRAVVDAILALPERNRFMKGLYAWVGFEAVGIEYQPPPRASGISHFDVFSLLSMALDGITAFTTWPLRLVSMLGMTLALPSFVYGGFLVVSYCFYSHPVSGWTTIIVCLLFFFGLQMLFVGILGEYIGRIFEEVKARPLFVVRRELGSGLERMGH